MQYEIVFLFLIETQNLRFDAHYFILHNVSHHDTNRKAFRFGWFHI